MDDGDPAHAIQAPTRNRLHGANVCERMKRKISVKMLYCEDGGGHRLSPPTHSHSHTLTLNAHTQSECVHTKRGSRGRWWWASATRPRGYEWQRERARRNEALASARSEGDLLWGSDCVGVHVVTVSVHTRVRIGDSSYVMTTHCVYTKERLRFAEVARFFPFFFFFLLKARWLAWCGVACRIRTHKSARRTRWRGRTIQV